MQQHMLDALMYGRTHGKSMLQASYQSQRYKHLLLDDTAGRSDIRYVGESRIIHGGLYPNFNGEIPVNWESESPTSARQDRHYLSLTVAEYQKFSECIQSGCYLSRDQQFCKIKYAKTKKLKNLRYKIRKSPYLMKSLIWQAQLRIIQNEIQRRREIPRHAKP